MYDVTEDRRFLLGAGLALALLFTLPARAEHPPGAGPPEQELDCIIEPSEVVDVGSAVPGIIERILVDRSDLVERDAVVAELESGVEEAALELARMRSELTTEIDLRQVSVAFGQRQASRNQELFHKNAISRQDMDRLETETRVSQMQLRQARDNQAIARLEYARVRHSLARRTIHSPVEGVVMERFKSVGEYVEDTPVLRVARLDPLHVEVIIPVDAMGRIHPGMQAEVTPVSPENGTYLAEVSRVDRVADAASGTFGARLALANPDYAIPGGLRCRLRFLAEGEAPSPGVVAAVPAAVGDTGAVDGESAALPAQSGAEVASEHTAAAPAPSVPDPQLPDDASVAVDEPAPAAPACYAVGPLRDAATASRLSDALSGPAAGVAVRRDGGAAQGKHMVVAPPQGNRGSTQALMARLEEAGVTDMFRIGRGELADRVSLGLYGSRKSAARRQRALAGRGFDTELVPVGKTAAYWVDVSAPDTVAVAERLRQAAVAVDPQATLEPTGCAPLASRVTD